MPISPNSLTTTAVLAPSGRASNSRIKVVLPAPRKPVTTVTGMRAPRGRRCRRPNGLASLPTKGSDTGLQLVHRTTKHTGVPVKDSEIHFHRVEPAGVAVDGIDDGAVVDEHVVDLAGAGRGVRHLRHEIGDFLRLVRVGDVEGAQPAIEEGAEHDLVRLPAMRLRQILPQVMRAEPAAAPREAFDRRHRAGRDRHRVLLGAVVDDPDELWPVDAVVA